MANADELKKYLKKFLLDNNHNGKTIMLSGAWGSGKTHFWQNEIEPPVKKVLEEDNRACVYVSLYGKESLKDIKSSVYLSANDENILSEGVRTFGVEALSAIKDSDFNVAKFVISLKNLKDTQKMNKGINRLKNGGIICFDDFERKSKDVDLNDLFGFISSLAFNLNCKVVIILNSDVFEGKEADVFRNVKEKTVNKLLYFEPTVEELFESIYNSDKKYGELDEHKETIKDTIIRTKELNARIYMQVLDNCLEWIQSDNDVDDKVIRVLVLSTFNFVLNHIVFDWNDVSEVYNNGSNNTVYLEKYFYKEIDFLDANLNNTFQVIAEMESDEEYPHNYPWNYMTSDEFINYLINTKKISSEVIEQNKTKIKALWKYGYELYYLNDCDEDTYNKIAKLVKTGIL